MVLSMSSRVFVGLPLCRDPAWLEVVSAYLAEVVGTAAALRPYPKYTRSVIRPFLAPPKRMARILARAREALEPAIWERRASDNQDLDLLSFLVQTSETIDVMSIILKLLVLTSAAVSLIRYPISSHSLICSL